MPSLDTVRVAEGSGSGRAAPTCGEQAALRAARSHRGRRYGHSAVALFFDARPVDLHPTTDRRFVPLPRLAFRLLGSPAQRPKQAPEMIDVILDVERLMNDFANPRARPQVCRKSRGASRFP